MFERFRQRSLEPENLDKGSYTPEEYEGCLVELRRVNEWLGDANALRDSLLREIERRDLKSFSVLDVGAGSGELLRVAAGWARETNRDAFFVGLELNERSAKAILEESDGYREIASTRSNGLALPFPDDSFDYVIQSLTLHHFDDEGAVRLVQEMARVAKQGIFVIDLHRNALAYFFYTTIGRLFLHNRLLREDGALSILKSFTPEELEGIGRKANLKGFKVEKYFPSRLILSADLNGGNHP
ncbi:MAG TPA: methyltransferase domain-containing protein [Pyrinomonadaceae bacterium]|nr:methyltransferase domain-containing protein [Pyrinomonadaceae bacterium]